MLTGAGTWLVWTSLKLNRRSRLNGKRVVVSTAGTHFFPEDNFPWQSTTPHHSVTFQSQIMALSRFLIWRRQIELWVDACYKNERESLSSEISFFLGMVACLPFCNCSARKAKIAWLWWKLQNFSFPVPMFSPEFAGWEGVAWEFVLPESWEISWAALGRFLLL